MDGNQWKVILNILFCKGNKHKRSSQTVKTMEFNNISNSPETLDFSFQESRSSNNSDILNKNTENHIANESLLNNKAATVDRVQKIKNRLSSLTLNTDSEGRFIRNNSGKEVNSNEVNKHPIMGKTALLKRNSVDSTDSAIIQSIILNKYENILKYYVDRMYTRRISRVSNVEDEDETIDNTNHGNWSSIKALDDYSYENNDKFDCLEFADNSNTETTKAILNNSICSEIDVISTCSEYDPRRFLVNILGEATSSNHLNSSKCNLNIETCEESVGTSAISSLLSTTSDGSPLKQINHNKRNKSKPAIYTDVTENDDMDFNENKKCSTSGKPNSTMDQYKMELSRQHSIIFQTSKALSYCKSSKDFIVGKERIEAERILLVATITKEALVNEINVMEFDSYVPAFDSRCIGEIMLSNLTFSISKEHIPKKSQDYKEIFVAVLKSGKTVFDSGVIENIDKIISIHKTFKFSKLLQDFEITIAVYHLLIINEDHISQDGKYSKCNVRNSFIKTETSAFNLIGKCQIKNSELTKISADGNLRLNWYRTSPHNPLQSFISVDVQSTFKLTNKLTGFLTLGIENGFISWNRRWCVLDGSVLRYWNYPSEESSVPIEIINLKYCTEHRISVADRSVCARPKTLYLPLQNSQSMKKYFISADTQSDLKIWESELNFVVKSLLIWRGMKNNLYS